MSYLCQEHIQVNRVISEAFSNNFDYSVTGFMRTSTLKYSKSIQI